MSEQSTGAWRVLESLAAVRERSALQDAALARERLSQFEENERRIIALRSDYKSRMRGNAGGMIYPADFRAASHFLDQLETLLESLRAEKTAVTLALDNALNAAARARQERTKYEELENLESDKRRSLEKSAAQRRDDAEAIMRFNFKSLNP